MQKILTSKYENKIQSLSNFKHKDQRLCQNYFRNGIVK